MLRDSFYTVSKHEHLPGAVKAIVSINKDHPIFEGHFPGHPVMPGVCMLQLVRELMETEAGGRLKINAATNMKFLAVINPIENKDVEVSVTYTNDEPDKFLVNATLFAGTVTFFKLVKGTLQRR